MKRSRVLSYGCGILGVGVSLFAAHAQKTLPLPEWTADKVLMKNLAEAVEIEGFSIQPPKDYEMQEGNAPEGMQLIAWGGEMRANGVRPSLALALFEPPKSESKKITLEQIAEKMIGGIKRSRTQWKQTKVEKGTINGVTFARLCWNGTEPTRNLKMQGFMYFARDKNLIIQLASQDTVSEAKWSLALAEASVFTFKKLP